MSPMVAAGLIFVAVAMITLFIAMLFEVLRDVRDRKHLTSRLEELDTELEESGRSDILRQQEELPPLLLALTARFPSLRDVDLVLAQADLAWTLQTFLLMTVGFAVGLGLGTLVATGNLLFSIIAATGGAFLPILYARMKRARRMRKLEEQLPEAIDLMARALRAGHPFASGIKMIADEMTAPVGTEFQRVFEEQRFGLAVSDALLSMVDRTTLLDVRIFVTAVLIQREVGGNLAEILDNLSYTIRERFRIRGEIRTRSAQGRMTGYLLAALPILTGLAFVVMSPEYIMLLFQDPMGHLIVAGALMLQIIGFLWIRKVVAIDI